MTHSQRFAALTLALLVVCSATRGQTAPPTAPEPRSQGDRTQADRGATSGASAPSQYRRRSIVHHYPHPYPEYYHGDQSAGFRNPGGVGRYAEYYSGTAGETAQQQAKPDPVHVARFDQGGGAPDRNEQLSARQIGVQRSNQIMNHIDKYARPNFGVGFFGGFN